MGTTQRQHRESERQREMNKRKYSQLEAGEGWRDRKLAEKMCQSKLKRLSSSTLYRTVLLKNTLKFVQNSREQNILFGAEGSPEPAPKKYCEDEDLIHDVNEILNEMIFPQSFLPSPDEMALEWPQRPDDLDVSIVPQVEIIEDEVDEDFLKTILCDRTNVTITKISDSPCLTDIYSTLPPQYSRYHGYPQSEFKIKPEITLIPATTPLLKC